MNRVASLTEVYITGAFSLPAGFQKTNVCYAVFLGSGDTATRQLSKLNWKGFVSWSLREWFAKFAAATS
jgi:hypothetical protein